MRQEPGVLTTDRQGLTSREQAGKGPLAFRYLGTEVMPPGRYLGTKVMAQNGMEQQKGDRESAVSCFEG